MTPNPKISAKAPATKASSGGSVKTSPAVKPKVVPKAGQTPPRVAAKKATVIKPSVASKRIKIVPALAEKTNKPIQAKAAPSVSPIISADQKSKTEKKKRQKMVRDSFNMPESDYAQIATLKKRCLKAGTSVKKSEVLRAALKCLSTLSDLALTKAISELEPVKAGRPAKR